MFSAALGQGATVNGQPLAVARMAALRQAMASTVFPKPHAPFMDAYLVRFGAVINEAAGRVNVFWRRGMGAWDSAAGVLLIREAGGEVFTLDGLPWLASKEVCAAVPGLAEAWRALLLAH